LKADFYFGRHGNKLPSGFAQFRLSPSLPATLPPATLRAAPIPAAN